MPLGGSQPVNLITRAHFTLLYEKEVFYPNANPQQIQNNTHQQLAEIYMYTSCTSVSRRN